MVLIRQHNLFRTQIMQFAMIVIACVCCASNTFADDHAENGHSADAAGHDRSESDHAHSDDHDHRAAGHSDDAHHDDGDHADGHHEKVTIWNDLSFWSIIAFAGFCLAIAKLGLWDSLVTKMASREQSENESIAKAEGHLASAQSTLNQYRGQLEAMDETVAETIAEAKRDAAHTEAEIVEIANREAANMLQRAEHEIARTKDQTLNDLFDHLSQRVTESVEAKLRTQLQSSDQDKLIDDTLGQLVSN